MPRQYLKNRGPEIIFRRELCLWRMLVPAKKYCILLHISTPCVRPRPDSWNWPSDVPNDTHTSYIFSNHYQLNCNFGTIVDPSTLYRDNSKQRLSKRFIQSQFINTYFLPKSLLSLLNSYKKKLKKKDQKKLFVYYKIELKF